MKKRPYTEKDRLRMKAYNAKRSLDPKFRAKKLLYSRVYKRQYHEKHKQIVYAHYGNKCACPKCPETNPAFLTLDHITSAARKRDMYKTYRAVGNGLYRKLINMGFPDDVRLLCYNCNCARSSRGNGTCPHML